MFKWIIFAFAVVHMVISLEITEDTTEALEHYKIVNLEINNKSFEFQIDLNNLTYGSPALKVTKSGPACKLENIISRKYITCLLSLKTVFDKHSHRYEICFRNINNFLS